MLKLVLYALVACTGLISIGLLPYALWAIIRYRLCPRRSETVRPERTGMLAAIADP